MALVKQLYRRNWDAKGARSTLVWHSPIADMGTNEAALRFSADPYDASLLCQACPGHFLNDDMKCGVWVFEAQYAPASIVARQMPDQPFEIEYESSIESYTLAGGYHWGDGSKVKSDRVQPTLQVAIGKVVLTGTRTTYNLGTFAAYMGNVNSGTFSGAAAGTVLFMPPTARKTTSPSNAGLYQVKCALWYRPVGWNNLFRESSGTFSPIYHDGDEAPPYAEVDFSPLLSAP